MSEPVTRAWRHYIDDMIQFSERVIAYIDGSIKAISLKAV